MRTSMDYGRAKKCPLRKTERRTMKGKHESIFRKKSKRFFHRKRTFLCASMSIEAALVLPVFLFFALAFTNFLLLLSLQAEMQLSMEEVARNLGKKAYFAAHTEELLQEVGEEAGEAAQEAGAFSAAINSLTVKALLLDGPLQETVNRSQIKGGTEGLYLYHSSYDAQEGILDIIVNYTYRIPFLPAAIGDLRFVQRCRSRVWTGKELKDSNAFGEGAASGEARVYVTPYGTVYHTSKECSYLTLSVKAKPFAEVESARNLEGKKYYCCTDCCRAGQSYETVYVTNYGTMYHSDLNCSGLKRTVEEVALSQVGALPACPRCGGVH